MALGVRIESGAGGDLSWLGSRHGVANARTVTLKASAFTDGIVPSGTAVAEDTDGFCVPYTGAEGQDLVGFILNHTNIGDGDEPVAVLDHGRVIVANLPDQDFEVPANTGSFVFVKGA